MWILDFGFLRTPEVLLTSPACSVESGNDESGRGKVGKELESGARRGGMIMKCGYLPRRFVG